MPRLWPDDHERNDLRTLEFGRAKGAMEILYPLRRLEKTIMQTRTLKNMEDGQLIYLANAKPTRIPLSVRVKARQVLKERGYRFIGTRIEKDE
jgi:hypothetical protein